MRKLMYLGLLAVACGEPAGPVNRPPVPAGSIPAQNVFIGDTVEVVVSGYFNDEDGDTLSYSAQSADATVASAIALSDTVRVIGVGQGGTNVTVTAHDPDGLSAVQVFGVTIPNRTPEPAEMIRDQSVYVDGSATVDLPEHFTDPDGDPLTYEAVSSDPGKVSVTVSGTMLTTTGMGVGIATVTVTATDAGGLFANQTFEATVPNRAPLTVDTIGDRVVEVDSTEVVDVSDHFTDPDRDVLTYSAVSSDASRATAEMSESLLTLTGSASGDATITVTARDPGDLTAEQTFEVTVPNRAPVTTDPIGNREVHVDDAVTIDLADHFEDPDGDDLEFDATPADPAYASVSVSGSSIRIEGISVGVTSVTASATDTAGLEAEQVFEVTIPNRAPVAVGRIPNQKVHVGDTVTVDVEPHFTDPDNEDLSYAAAASKEVAVTVSGSVVTISGVKVGDATVTVTAMDPGGSEAEQVFEVSVPNRAPTVSAPIGDREISMDDTVTINLAGHFEDPEGDSLGYEAKSSDTKAAKTEVSGDVVRVLAVARGSATVTVTASDPGGLSAEQTFNITVPNSAPEITDSIPAMEVTVGRMAEVRALNHFTDPDGDELRYEAESSNADNAAVSVSNDTISVSGAAVGTATITVTARDPEDLSASQSFSVEVLPDRQRDALVAFYNALNGPNWRINTNWLTDAPLDEWHGIVLDDEGEVIRMLLARNWLEGEIPPEIGDLTSLKYLLLEYNSIHGPLPPEIGNLTNLTHLYLSVTDITGPLPPELGNLTKLTTFLARDAKLDGSIPPELGDLRSLVTLYLYNNPLTGSIPPELDVIW